MVLEWETFVKYFHTQNKYVSDVYLLDGPYRINVRHLLNFLLSPNVFYCFFSAQKFPEARLDFSFYRDISAISVTVRNIHVTSQLLYESLDIPAAS